MPHNHPLLIAEDDEDTVFFLRRSFDKLGLKHPLKVVNDGAEAIHYLEGEAREKSPGLLLLDIKMPFKSGFDVLESVRANPQLKRVPVIIFSSSNRPQDVNRAYDLGANSYVVKPCEAGRMDEFVRKIHDYWMHLNESPIVD